MINSLSMVRENFNAIKEDKLLLFSILIIIAEVICYIREFIFSEFSIQPLIRIIFGGAYLLSALFFRRRFIYLIFTLMALAITYFNKFTNYTSFFILAIIAIKNPRWKIWILSAYCIDVVISLLAGNRLASHSLIHILNCILIYLFLEFIISDSNKLKLTPDEIKILEEWKENGDLKSCESFSKNSLFKKLKEARERNSLETNEALLSRYYDEIRNKRE